MKALLFLLALPLLAQQATPTSRTPLSNVIVSGGGGIVTTGGRFAYGSESTFIGQNTYATVIQEWTLSHGQVQSCTMGGITKLLYTWGWVTAFTTAVAGGCQSTSGSSGVGASTQLGIDVRWGKKLPFGTVITAMKNTTGGVQITIGPHFLPNK